MDWTLFVQHMSKREEEDGDIFWICGISCLQGKHKRVVLFAGCLIRDEKLIGVHFE